MEKEDTTMFSRDSDSSSLEDSLMDSSSSEENVDAQDPEDARGVSAKEPSVIELWSQFEHKKTVRFLQVFESKKPPSMWEMVRKRVTKKKQKKKEHPSEPVQRDPQTIKPPCPEECLTDDEIKMKTPVVLQTDSQLPDCSQEPQSKEVAPWRYGPAKLWYDMLDVPPHGRGFDYGFKIKEKLLEEEVTPQKDDPLLKDENFLMATQKSWEDDIIWDNRDIQESCPNAQKVAHAGWIPSENTRSFKTGICDPSQPVGSRFEPENEDLIYDRWEDNIIWDAQAMSKPLHPTVLTLNADDENLLLVNMEEPEEEETTDSKQLTQKQSSKKNELKLKCGILEEDEDEQISIQQKAKDPWNLSNDEFYFPQQHGLQVSLRVPIIQHSTPALKLHHSLFPTNMEPEQLRLFHRPQLKWLCKGPQPVHSLTHLIETRAKEREQKLQDSGGGHMFFMKTFEDLSGQDGDLILVEWSEENPPFLNQVGMASQIQNYYKRKIGKDTGPPAYNYGNLVLCSSSPFLGELHAGQFLQALENKLYRAPIYPHQMADTDFLVVKTKAGCFLREVKHIFTVGQQCPLDEVPAPNSKMAKDYMHEFLQVFIYRQFQNSPYRPRRIRMEDIRKAFPRLAESSIRRRLTKCSDFHRTGIYFNWWVMKPEFRLPSEEELRAIVTPEKCCALYSMLAAQQRLKDAGYGEVSLLDTEDTSGEDKCLEDEVQAAPWNTTRTFLSATKGQCMLEVMGAADPTGCGEGISYVKLKQENKTQMEAMKLMGTDADLRRLTMSKAQRFLRGFGISEEEIKKLSRWEVIAAVRALSTKELQSGTKPTDLTKFARVSHAPGAEQRRQFQQDVQRVFDLQNKVLSCTDVMSTDTDDSTSDEEDDNVIEKMCHDIENLLEGKTNLQRLQRQKEKQDLRELQQLMLGGDDDAHLQGKSNTKKQDGGPTTLSSEYLVIRRTYVDEFGKEYVRSEIVRNPAVIKAYIQVKTTKNEDSIRQFIQADEEKQKELRKEKKRLQDRLRRIRIAKEKKEQNEHLSPQKLPKLEAPKLNLICGACGSHGHIKTNKMCPKYLPNYGQAPKLKIMTQEQEEKELAKRLPMESIIKVQETTLFMKKKAFESMKEIQKESMKVRIEKYPLPKKNPTSSIRKGHPMPMDSEENLSCIRHPCKPASPSNPPKKHSNSPYPIPSLGDPLEKTGKSPVNFREKSEKTLPPPVQLALSEPEAPSYSKPKHRTPQNRLSKKNRSLTQPCRKGPDFMAQTQKPMICRPKEGLSSPCLPSHPTREPPVQLALSEPEEPSYSKPKDWSLQNWLSKKNRSLTQSCQKGPDFTAQTQKPMICRPKEGLPSHPSRESQDSPTSSKLLLHDSFGHRSKRPRSVLDQSGQNLTQEPKAVSKGIREGSLQRPPLDKDTQPAFLQKSVAGKLQAPSQDRTPVVLTQKHQTSVLYEDLQVSDSDEEESEEDMEVDT